MPRLDSITSNNKTNHNLITHVFPPFSSATCIYQSFSWFIGLSVSFVTGQGDQFGFGFIPSRTNIYVLASNPRCRIFRLLFPNVLPHTAWILINIFLNLNKSWFKKLCLFRIPESLFPYFISFVCRTFIILFQLILAFTFYFCISIFATNALFLKFRKFQLRFSCKIYYIYIKQCINTLM